MNNLLGRRRARHALDIERASAHLDGRLDAGAVATFEAHIAGCETCREQFAGLRDARAALRSLPQAEPPRSFRLRAADVQAMPRRTETPRLVRMMPALSAAAIVAFAVIAGADALRGSVGTSGDMAASRAPEPMAAGARESASGETAPVDARSDYATQSDSASAPGAGATSELAPAAPAFVPPTTDAGNDTAGPSKAASADPTPAFSETSTRDAAPEPSGDIDAFRMAELIAAAVALAAGGTFIVWRLRKG